MLFVLGAWQQAYLGIGVGPLLAWASMWLAVVPIARLPIYTRLSVACSRALRHTSQEHQFYDARIYCTFHFTLLHYNACSQLLETKEWYQSFRAGLYSSPVLRNLHLRTLNCHSQLDPPHIRRHPHSHHIPGHSYPPGHKPLAHSPQHPLSCLRTPLDPHNHHHLQAICQDNQRIQIEKVFWVRII